MLKIKHGWLHAIFPKRGASLWASLDSLQPSVSENSTQVPYRHHPGHNPNTLFSSLHPDNGAEHMQYYYCVQGSDQER